MFGDSNTFGEGVSDADTYPAQLARRGGGQWGVYNFGVSGWAAHEMLAGLQSGRFRKSLACAPTQAVFFLICDHFRRIVGHAPWELHTPRYRLGADGRPVRAGNFDSDGPPVTSPPAEDSSLWTVRGWQRLLAGQTPETPEEVALMAALLVESARAVRDMAPQARFDVIYWTDADDALLDELAHTLRSAGIGVHPVETIVPGYRRHWRDYLLSGVDRHPTAATHGRIADYIARHIVKQ